MCIGQLNERLIRPYQRMPLQLASLVDASHSEEYRLNRATDFLQKRSCCVERHCARPILEEMRKSGGSKSILPGNVFFDDLSSFFRMKNSNIEIELNFARSSNMRRAMRGRNHSISSMTSKHVGAEIKLAQRRQQALLPKKETPTPGVTGSLAGVLYCSLIISSFFWLVLDKTLWGHTAG